MADSQTIEHLTLRWRCKRRESHTPATRLRLERLLSTLDLRPPGMPAGAILVIRRIDGLPPLSDLSRLPANWEQQLNAQLAASYRAAGRPGSIADQAPAMLFTDAAELLIYLTRAVVHERAGFLRHWYWRELLPLAARQPATTLAFAWTTYARALPPALAALQPTERYQALMLLTPQAVQAVGSALCAAFELPPYTLAAPAPALATTRSQPEWPAATSPLPPLRPQQARLLALALALAGDPARVRAMARAGAPMPPAAPAPAAPAAPSTAPGPVKTTPASPDPIVPAAPPAPASDPATGAPLAAEGAADPAIPATAKAPALPQAPTRDYQVPAPPRPLLPTGVPTSLAGIFYLINLFNRLGWPLTDECAAGLYGWTLIEAVARGLLTAADDDDPVWPLLARLAGREPGTLLGTAPAADSFRLPLVRPPVAWTVATYAERILVYAADGGYLLADLPRQGRTTAQAVADEMAARGMTATWEPAVPALPAPLAPALKLRLGPAIAGWLARASGYLHYVLHRLGAGPEELLRRRGRLAISRTHIDLYLPLEQVSLPIRRAGLDADPGWMPDLGYIVLFHFGEEAWDD